MRHSVKKILKLQDKVTMELPNTAKPITKTDALTHVNKFLITKLYPIPLLEQNLANYT